MKEANRNLGGVKQKVGGLQDEIKRVQDENKELLHKLRFDCLTGAYNRMAFDEFLALEKNRFDRYRRPFSVIMFDIDHFKNINDSLGHLVGDKCLQECIRHIRPALRKNDILARFGGDEFVVLLPETNLDQAMETADKLRRTIEETEFYFRKKKLPLTISAGASEAAAEDPAAETVVNRADQALLEAKRMGKNTVRPAG
jgi:diguanylate cyclase (GGDEF)-like protein